MVNSVTAWLIWQVTHLCFVLNLQEHTRLHLHSQTSAATKFGRAYSQTLASHNFPPQASLSNQVNQTPSLCLLPGLAVYGVALSAPKMPPQANLLAWQVTVAPLLSNAPVTALPHLPPLQNSPLMELTALISTMSALWTDTTCQC